MIHSIKIQHCGSETRVAAVAVVLVQTATLRLESNDIETGPKHLDFETRIHIPKKNYKKVEK